MDGFPGTNIVGRASGEENPFYTPVRAAAEHKWMEMQIEEAKKAVNAEDQIEGSAASPYGKYTVNEEEALKQGRVRRATETEATERNRIIDDRAKKVAEQAADKIDREIEKKHVGRRHDG